MIHYNHIEILPKEVCDVEDKQNEEVLRWTNNQAPASRPTQEWKYAPTTFKRTHIRSEINSCSCNWSINEDYIWK
jgi:hypothetical protein